MSGFALNKVHDHHEQAVWSSIPGKHCSTMKESRCKVLRCKVAMCLSMASADELDDDTSTILGLSKEYRLVGVVVNEWSDVFEIDDLSVSSLNVRKHGKKCVGW